MTASVDVIVAVHDPARPVERAVGSALAAARTGVVRVRVVVHNTPADPVARRLGRLAADPAVELLELHDGIPSPAGPFNAGLDAASASFTSVLGSDDELEPGAIDSWLATARRTGADAVIARLRHAGGRAVPTPPTRPVRRRLLDPVADRLSYRSAPLGLVSTDRYGDLRFTTGLPVGEDVAYVTRLWFSGGGTAYDRRGPAYLIHTDSAGRTTVAPRPFAEELAYLPIVLADPWFTALPARDREAIVVKFLRIHLFGAVTNRSDHSGWTPADRVALRDHAQLLIHAGSGIQRVLSRRDRALLDACLDIGTPTDVLLALAAQRRRFAHPASLLPRSLSDTLHREAPIRFSAASVLQLP